MWFYTDEKWAADCHDGPKLGGQMGGAGRGTGAWLVNGNVLWKYLNAMSVSMGAPAAGKSLQSVVRLVQSQLCSVAVRHHPEPSRQDSFIKA